MKRTKFLFTLLLVSFSFFTCSKNSLAYSILWQIGTPHGSVNPIVGAGETPATGFYSEIFHYYVGLDPDPILSPHIPGYLGLQNVGEIDPARPWTDTTSTLNIHFALATGYSHGELSFIYDRYGSENDLFFLDGILVGDIKGTSEGSFQHFGLPLDAIAPGNHTIAVKYNFGGSNNGHYIDFFQLRGPDIPAPVPEPSTIFLVSCGLIGLRILPKRDGSDDVGH